MFVSVPLLILAMFSLSLDQVYSGLIVNKIKNRNREVVYRGGFDYLPNENKMTKQTNPAGIATNRRLVLILCPSYCTQA